MSETTPQRSDRSPDVDQPEGGAPSQDAEGTGRTPRSPDVDQPDGGSPDSDRSDDPGSV